MNIFASHDGTDEYFTLPKLLNHIELNIKIVERYKLNIVYPEATKEQLKTEKLLRLALEIFNTLNEKLKGSSLYIDHIAADAISTLMPITKFYQLRKKIISTKRTKETTIEIEELNKIIK